MTVINIRSNISFYRQNGCFCKPIQTVSDSLKKSVSPGERLTGEKAIKVLRKIEIKSKIQSFLTKPVVAVSLTLAATVGGYLCAALSTFSVALTIFGIVMGITASILLGITIKAACEGSLNKMSVAYDERAKEAAQYIKDIKAAQRAGHQVTINPL